MRLNWRRRGFSLIELLIVISIILIIASIAVPNMHKQLMLTRGQAAIQQITTIHQAQTHYFSEYGKYSCALGELGPPASGAPGPTAADIIPKKLADGKNSGYIFAVTCSPIGYSVTAVPEAFNNTGNKSFYSDQSLVIRQSITAEPASANSPPI